MPSEVKHDKYEAAKINLLLRQLKSAAEKGQPIEYEILVDGYVVVPRTSDADRFNSFAEYIHSDSEGVTIVLFKGLHNEFDKYFFELKNTGKKKPEGLGEIPEGVSPGEWLEKQKESWHRELRQGELERENTRLQKELEEKDKALKEFAEKFSQLKEGKLLGISEIGTGILLNLLKHPKVQENFPVLNGFVDAQAAEKSNEPEEQTASFSRKGENKTTHVEQIALALSEKEEGFIMFMREVEANLSKVQEDNLMRILGQLVKYPIAIGSTLKHLYNFLNSRPQVENNTQEEQA
jgi:hypothetical protein